MADINARVEISYEDKSVWIDLPYGGDYDEIIDEEEFEVADFESDADLDLNYMVSLDFYNIDEIVTDIESLDGDEYDKFLAYSEAVSNNVDDALEAAQDDDVILYSHCDTFADLAREFVDYGFWGEIDSTIIYHIDFESLGNDISHDGYYETSLGVLYTG